MKKCDIFSWSIRIIEWGEGRNNFVDVKSLNTAVPKLLVGVFGVAASAASFYGDIPLDVVKTRMQGLEAHKYTTDCMLQIWKKEGPTA